MTKTRKKLCGALAALFLVNITIIGFAQRAEAVL